jgi:DMSO/TMAO reductase YedYZ molybdopterin-dependent catalytic subunit
VSATRSNADSARREGFTRDLILAGVLALAVLLGVAELVAALLPGAPSLVIAVGDVVIDVVPGWLERAVISLLGTADKPFLIGVIIVLSGLLGAAIGMVAARRLLWGAVALAVYTAFGVAAALADPQGNVVGPVLTGLAGFAAGFLTLRALLAAGTSPEPGAAAATASAGDGPAAPESGGGDQRVTVRSAGSGGGAGSAAAEPMPRPNEGGAVDRRRFLTLAGAATAVAAISAIGGRAIAGGSERIERIRQAIRIPRPARPAPPPPAGADLEIRGLTPLYVRNEDFFRIDTALRVPRVDPQEWSLQIGGRVDRPYRLTYEELMRIPQIEADITLACVSNEVGDELVGNARWQGVPLYVLLERAGLQEGATQLVGRSVDGFTAGFPTLTALDVKESMVAVAMNGEPLPLEHGFPARLVVPGLYGYVSATKWLSSIELRGWNEVDGYWIPRGWAKEGPIKTQSRIDVPAASSTIPAARRPIAGVAWAPTRGIERVEVRVDEGPWQEATLAARLDVDCWRQWFLAWEATPGRHVIAVRATDGRGEVQTDERTPVAPDGASGRHTIEVFVQ